jgi:MFS family permease
MTTSSTIEATAQPPACLERGPARDRLWTTRFVLLLTVMVAFGFAFSIFFLLPKYLATQLFAGAQAIGRVSAAAMLAGVLCVPLLGPWIDRSRRRLLIAGGAMLMGVSSIGFVWVDTVGPYIFVLRALQGVAFTLVFNAAAALTADLAPPRRLGQAIGYFGVSVLCTNAMAPLAAEAIAERAGWAPVFVLGGVAATLSAGLALRIREPSQPRRPAAFSYRGLLSRPRVAVLLVAAVCGCALGTMFTFTQPFALQQGIHTFGGFFASYTLGALVMRVGLGSVADRFGRQRVGAATLVLYGLVVLATAGLRPGWLEPLGAVFGVAHGLFYPAMTAFAVEHVERDRRGVMLTLFNGAFNAGVAVSVAVLGAVAEAHGYPIIFVLVGLVTLATAAALARIRIGNGEPIGGPHSPPTVKRIE